MQALVLAPCQAFWALGLSVVRSGLFSGFHLVRCGPGQGPWSAATEPILSFVLKLPRMLPC